MLAVTCPFCDREHELDDHWVGRIVRCRRCGRAFDVPEPIPQISWVIPKTIALLMVTVAVLVVGLGVAWYTLSPSRLTRQQFLAVREGMNESEVRAILGEPTQRYAEGGRMVLRYNDGHSGVRIVLAPDPAFANIPRVVMKWQEGLE